ncbi:DUF2797 domain-containing protein [Yinghuangia sp. ASG 101]|uniref:DUF2797 domain-containing protein n=1 Tax=Yinghuangia sp. ASG 101 TaxID=2896848 RepID=UPI001E557CA7|nr:DUF2797 domain-containing protein [Yinghuangia sp. ASG 101]
MDRSSSIATDTRLDDPRPFAVYLAHHGDAGIKIGITAVERGTSRLLEQGAFASVIIGHGALTTARRSETVLGRALGLPERITARAKRAARRAPGTAEQRTSALRETREQALTNPAWPDTLHRIHASALDHTTTYGLSDTGIADHRELAPPTVGDTVTGRIRHAIGCDIYVETPLGLVLVDTRLLAGWGLTTPEPDSPFTAALREPEPTPQKGPETDALF